MTTSLQTNSLHWRQRIGSQRDWVWRGWQTRYTYLRSKQADAAPPLMLLHGFGASIGHWRQNLSALAEHHTVYALDMLGFGASEKAIAPYNISLWVEQVYDFWRTFIRVPIVLIGNSIGSLVCVAAAAAHPDMVCGIAMLSLPDPSIEQEMIPEPIRPIVNTIKSWVASPFLLNQLFKFARNPKGTRRWVSIAYANRDAVTDELVEILVDAANDHGSAQAFCAIMRAIISPDFGPSVKKILPELKIPMLLIWGAKDRMIPPSLAAQFASYNPRLKLVEIDAGHCSHDEAPEQVNPEILNWIASWNDRPLLKAEAPPSL
ncbi:alpha/beta fold hydrolase [Phormidesmis sp. 146-12]